MPAVAPPASLSQSLAEQISRRIMLGKISLGSWLRQDAVAAEFGVSRTPVREAFRVLAAQGILEMVPYRGALVLGPSPRDIRELSEVRAELEAYAAELAALRIRDDQLVRLRAAEDGFGAAIAAFVNQRDDDADGEAVGEAWVRANEAFHGVILEASGNDQLRVSIEDVHRRLPRNITIAALSDSHLLEANVHEHEEIRQAIEARDPAAARAAMRAHLRHGGDLIARWVESQSAP